VFQFVIGGVAAYGLVVGGLWLLQESLLFPRAAISTPTFELPERAERVELRSAEGHRLVGALLPARRPSRGLLLGFGGNAWNADDLLLFLARRVPDHDVVVFHYRGYPPSEGQPSEAALYADALLVHDWAVRRLAPPRVVVFGASLGSAVAAHLAAHRSLDGLVLVTPFDSIEAIAAERYFWAPVRALLRHPFRAAEHLRGRDLPVAVILAEDDRIVPRARSEALIEVLARPVLVATVPGAGHNAIYEREEFDRYLLDALRAIERATLRDSDGSAGRLGSSSEGGAHGTAPLLSGR
jgi:pimeloyl-ACP methyl ester carboxylesterase